MASKNPVAAGTAVAGIAVAVILLLAGCGSAHVPGPRPPAIIEPVAGAPVPKLLLTAQAIRRLGVTTQPLRQSTVSSGGKSAARAVIPYAAVVYATDGSSWTYVNTADRTYSREPITIQAIEGDTAVLTAGPPAGALVVTVGAAELLGVEYNISGEG